MNATTPLSRPEALLTVTDLCLSRVLAMLITIAIGLPVAILAVGVILVAISVFTLLIAATAVLVVVVAAALPLVALHFITLSLLGMCSALFFKDLRLSKSYARIVHTRFNKGFDKMLEGPEKALDNLDALFDRLDNITNRFMNCADKFAGPLWKRSKLAQHKLVQPV